MKTSTTPAKIIQSTTISLQDYLKTGGDITKIPENARLKLAYTSTQIISITQISRNLYRIETGKRKNKNKVLETKDVMLYFKEGITQFEIPDYLLKEVSSTYDRMNYHADELANQFVNGTYADFFASISEKISNEELNQLHQLFREFYIVTNFKSR